MSLFQQYIRPRLALALILGGSLAACGGGGADSGPVVPPAPMLPPTMPPVVTLPVNPAVPATRSVQVDFVALNQGQPIQCGQTMQLGAGTAPATLRDLRLYVSSISLIRADDVRVPVMLEKSMWQDPASGTVLIDLEDASGGCSTEANTTSMNSQIRGTVPAGNYVGIAYEVGVPASANHTDTVTAPAPLDNAAMAWSWQSGRKFLRVEVLPEAGVKRPATATTPESIARAYMVHLGSAACTGNPATGATTTCAQPNRMAFHSHDFNVDTQKLGIDIGKLLAQSDITVDNGGAIGCMSSRTDPECPAIFSNLRINQDTGQPIDDGQGQSLFTVVAR